MAQVEVTYSDNHTIHVESDKKLKVVTFSGKYEDGYEFTHDITEELPYEFNPKSLGLLKNSIFDLDVILGGEDVMWQFLRTSQNIGNFGSPTGSISAGGTYTYTVYSSWTIETFFQYIGSSGLAKLNEISSDNGNIVIKAVLSANITHANSLSSNDTMSCLKGGFIMSGTGNGMNETITVYGIYNTTSYKGQIIGWWSPDLVSDFTGLYFGACNLSSNTDVSTPVWYYNITYWAAPMEELNKYWIDTDSYEHVVSFNAE